MINIGNLTKRIELVSPDTNIRDDYGEVTGERVVAKPWCSIKALDDSEVDNESRVSNNETIELHMRWNKELGSDNPKSSFFIRYKGQAYDIVSVLNPMLKNERLIVKAVKRG